ncbi:FAD-dependent monooxygenase [Pseudactinotalea terrae]|uniref:FAD-dependent monooxygenase n=1 Tax=Pseudactinotalea terrae TaxID=1743262 RepID=UPI0012E31F51|nr:FAD-dependent monooxygenase [Pseudactinotalea terrae]
MTDADVVVIGAGPTGLLLAGDLAEAGLQVRLLEKRSQRSNLTRAFAVHARTLEHLQVRGLADALVATGHPVDGLQLFGSVTLRLTGLDSPFPYLLVTPQLHVERLLLERALDHGVQIVEGAEVTGLSQDDGGVLVASRDAAGAGPGSTSTVTAAPFAVGTDGYRSAVRDALGLDFPGRSAIRSLMLADVRLTAPPRDLLTVRGNSHGFVFVVPFGDGWHRVIARDARREVDVDSPASLEEVRDVVTRVLGTDLGMTEARWTSRFHSDERQVARYRVGRVLLAGDAAHVHSPAGGMGMNTGLQDAANLSWKLAAVLAGRAEEAMLDSYHDERHAVGEQVLRTSGGLIRAALLRHPLSRAMRDLAVRAALALPPASAALSGRVSGIALRYPAPQGSHALVGRRAVDGGVGLGIEGGRFALVAPEPLLARHRASRHLATCPIDAGVPAQLVRPDGYVAWARAPGDRGEAGLSQAMRRWGALTPSG